MLLTDLLLSVIGKLVELLSVLRMMMQRLQLQYQSLRWPRWWFSCFMYFLNSYLVTIFLVGNLIFFIDIALQTPEVLELSKQIKEKLKEADQYGNTCFLSMNFSFLLSVLELVGLFQLKIAVGIGSFSICLLFCNVLLTSWLKFPIFVFCGLLYTRWQNFAFTCHVRCVKPCINKDYDLDRC